MSALNSLVLMQFVPDLVDELEIDESSGTLDRTFMRLMPNEMDEHALEAALLLKERYGGTVTVVAPEVGDTDEALYTAVAKGADRVIKLVGEGFEERPSNPTLCALIDGALAESGVEFDIILVGTQAVDDLDASLGSLLAARRDLPFVGYTTRIEATDGGLRLAKEYPGGLLAQVDVEMPAVIGIQAAEQPPRYVVTTLVTEAMKTASIDEVDVGAVDTTVAVDDLRMRAPEATSHAEMLGGDVSEVVERLVDLLQEREIIHRSGGGS